MGSRKILIIDDNGENGVELSTACRRLAPEWDAAWLRVISPGPDPLDEDELEGAAYRVIGDAGEATAAIREAAADAACGLIVFYDLHLFGVQVAETKGLLESPITVTLRGLMNEPGRRMLMVIHSAHAASPVIADNLDNSGQRAFTALVTGKQREHIEDVIKQTLARWEEEYPSESMTADQFLAAMGEMSHGQIQEYEGFLKETLDVAAAGKEEEERRRIEAELRRKHPDPKEVLRVYLRMGVPEFEEHFCGGAKDLKGEVVEALKCIAGVDRRLSWGGAWLLALGVFRQLLPRDSWKTIFDPAELGANQERWPSVHAVQKQPRRLETVRLFAEMCRVLFTKKGDPKQSVLEKVELAVEPETGRPQMFSFRLDFPCVGDDDDQSESLLGRLVDHVDTALAAAEGKQVGPAQKQSRDTSRAIWRFFLSAAICDIKEVVSKPGYGLAGGFSPMNIMSVSRNTKTEVLWLN